jgi:N-acetylglutamate synthase
MGTTMRDRRSSLQRYRDVFAERDLVRELEEIADRAYPALTVLELDGWRLRAARGLPLRLNAAWPRAAGERLDLDRRIDAATRFYHRRGQPAAALITPSVQPRGLDRALAERGWARVEPRTVQSAPIDSLAASRQAAGVQLSGEPVSPWQPAWASVLDRVRVPTVYAFVEERGRLSAARGVLDGGWLGVLDITGSRASLLVAALARWGAGRGAERVYVDAAAPVPGLRTAYRYWYRVAS